MRLHYGFYYFFDNRYTGKALRLAHPVLPARPVEDFFSAARWRLSAYRAYKFHTGQPLDGGKDCWSEFKAPSSLFDKPSTVVTTLPSSRPTGTIQAHTARPSSKTVQAPQSPASQPTFVPVRPNCSRRTWVNLLAGSAVTTTVVLFNVKFTVATLSIILFG